MSAPPKTKDRRGKGVLLGGGFVGGFGVVDLDVVEVAVLAGAAELYLRLGRVGDAGRLEEGDGLGVDGGAHRVADGFEDEGVPLARVFEAIGKGGAGALEELVALV